MKHREATLKTKQALAASLKKFMMKKPFGKITVSEIIEDCKLNRKTFYYHFDDIYALLKWMFEQEAIEVVKQFDLLVDYEDAINFVIDYIDKNTHILNCAFDSLGMVQMKRFLDDDFLEITRSLIDGVEQEYGLSVTDDFKDFLANLYAEAIAGAIVDWFAERDKRPRETFINYFIIVIRSSLPATLMSAPKKSIN